MKCRINPPRRHSILDSPAKNQKEWKAAGAGSRARVLARPRESPRNRIVMQGIALARARRFRSLIRGSFYLWTHRESNSGLCNANAPVYHLPMSPRVCFAHVRANIPSKCFSPHENITDGEHSLNSKARCVLDFPLVRKYTILLGRTLSSVG